MQLLIVSFFNIIQKSVATPSVFNFASLARGPLALGQLPQQPLIPLVPNTTTTTPAVVSSSSAAGAPIQCHFAECKKSFRKQSLLDYHLKYHHYANTAAATTAPSVAGVNQGGRRRRASTQHQQHQSSDDVVDDEERANEVDDEVEEEEEEEEDPYEVIHCKCGSQSSLGFMIQCEICLCWQHGECASIRSAECVPAKYLCWVCEASAAKLRSQRNANANANANYDANWMTSSSGGGGGGRGAAGSDRVKLRMLNECSRRYYNLHLLMNTLDYQMSVLAQSQLNSIDGGSGSGDGDSADNEQAEKLMLNIVHLQRCLSRRFDEFNAKINGKFALFFLLYNKNKKQKINNQLVTFVCVEYRIRGQVQCGRQRRPDIASPQPRRALRPTQRLVQQRVLVAVDRVRAFRIFLLLCV